MRQTGQDIAPAPSSCLELDSACLRSVSGHGLPYSVLWCQCSPLPKPPTPLLVSVLAPAVYSLHLAEVLPGELSPDAPGVHRAICDLIFHSTSIPSHLLFPRGPLRLLDHARHALPWDICLCLELPSCQTTTKLTGAFVQILLVCSIVSDRA